MVIFRKKSLIIISVLIATVFTLILCLSAISINPASDIVSNKFKIVLDAGHGGIDSGAIGIRTGAKESEINLEIVKKLEKKLLSAGINVLLTRNSQAGLYGVVSSSLKRKDMEKRRDIINDFKPNLIISVHLNKYSVSSRRGAQVFYKENDEVSKILANCVQKNFNSMKESIREFSILTGDYYILNCTKYPGIIAECGFLSNPEEEALLITDKYQDELANNIFKGIIEFMSKTTNKNLK